MARFEGTSDYVATADLKVAVNAAVALERPLLVKGEPGTGKTVLAYEIAKALDAPLITWHVKSTTKAHQGLYEYDAVSRLRDSQLGDADAIASLADAAAVTPGMERALLFGATQIAVQHRGLWDLLEARQQARSVQL